MRRKRDKMLAGDLKVFKQDYPSVKEAAKFARLARKVVHSSKIHVRRGIHVVIKTEFSADAWAMTFSTLLMMLKRGRVVEPKWLWKYVNECAEFARERKTWYLKTKRDKRVSCMDFMNQWRGIIDISDVKKSWTS